MKTNLSEMINATAAVPTLKISPSRPRRRRALLAAGLLLLVLGGATGPGAWGATDQTSANAYELSQLDQIPVARYQARPVYPFELSRAGVTGEATVGFIVDSAGNVRNAYAVKSTHAEFGAAAVEAVNKWKFRAGERGGKAVNTRMQVPIVFALSGPSIGGKTKAETN